MHKRHPVEESVQLLGGQRSAEFRDSPRDLASSGRYGFSFSLVVHVSRKGVSKTPAVCKKLSGENQNRKHLAREFGIAPRKKYLFADRERFAPSGRYACPAIRRTSPEL
jgi:hypothetical protein